MTKARPWLSHAGRAADNDRLVLRDDRRSRLSRLIYRQLAVAGRCSIDQLAACVLRAQPDPQRPGSLICGWDRYQPY